jgi:hypothetical protein
LRKKDRGWRFELADQRGSYLVPEALPATEPDGAWSDEDVLRFRYEYELLPVGLVPQLIVEAHRLLDRERPTCWRLGAVFHHADCKALVRADRERGRIDIAVWGPDKQRRSALNVVCVHLDGVHASHKELGHAARVPLPEQPDVTVGYEHLLRLEQSKGSAYLWLPEGAEREYTVPAYANPGLRLRAADAASTRLPLASHPADALLPISEGRERGVASQCPSKARIFASASSITSRGARSKLRARRARQSRLLT